MVAATLLRRSSNSVPFPILVSYPPTPKSFPCHTSENLPLSPTIATLPKTDLSNPSICHTSETPWGAWTFSGAQTFIPDGVTGPAGVSHSSSHKLRNLPSSIPFLLSHLQDAFRATPLS